MTWRKRAAPDQAWRSPIGQSRRQGQEEQDDAAGTRRARALTTPSGDRATARIHLRRRAGTRRAYTYLRWDHHNVRYELLIGEATHPQRTDNLAAGWALVSKNGLLQPAGRTRWHTTVSPPEST